MINLIFLISTLMCGLAVTLVFYKIFLGKNGIIKQKRKENQRVFNRMGFMTTQMVEEIANNSTKRFRKLAKKELQRRKEIDGARMKSVTLPFGSH